MDGMSSSSDSQISITKSRSDLKTYKLVTLQSGLEVLLVDASKLAESRKTSPDDKETSHKAAAAMYVNVGSFADPSEAEGCAHFLEHMIFMGVDSPKYPNSENLYDSFVSSHGGSCNAFTEGEYTVYQFDIAAEYFAEALDIFACCFKSPLLSISSSDREIKSIESEFSLAKVSDGTRLQQLMCDAASEGHVLRKFSWGNTNSLSTVPKSKNIDIHTILQNFYKTHYVPSAMKLVVLAPKAVDEIEKNVIDSFADWVALPTPPAESTGTNEANGKRKRKKAEKVETALHLPSLEDCVSPFRHVTPFRTDGQAYLSRVIPVKKAHKLILTWYLPSCIADYKTKPDTYISHLLGHEGPGSLLSALKSSGLASGVSAGISSGNMESNSMFSLFAATVYLTTKGLANWVQVAGRVFEYVALMRKEGPHQWIFDEIQKIAEIDFGFLDEEEESDFVERLCVEMAPIHGRDRKDLLTAPYLYWAWDPETVSAHLALMTPLACRFELLSCAFVHKDGEKEAKKAGKRGDGDDSEEEDEDEEGDDDDDDYDDEDDDDDDDDDEDDSEGDSEDDDEDDDGKDGGSSSVEEDLSSAKIQSLYSGPEEWRHLCLLPASEGPEVKEPLKEPHFGTQYWQDPLPPGLIKQWADVQPSADLHLPPPNPFIPDDLSLDAGMQKNVDCAKLRETDPEGAGKKAASKGQELSASASTSSPTRIVGEDGLSVWHLLDMRFPVPKVQICCQFSSPLPHQSPGNAAAHDLFVKLIADCLTETLYMASMAELHCDIVGTSSSIVLKVSGFSDKACLLMETALLNLFSPALYLLEAAVERQLELLKRTYNNANMKAADAAISSRLLALAPMKHSCDSKLRTLLAVEETEPEVAPKTKGSKGSKKGSTTPMSPVLRSVSEYTRAFLAGLCAECLVHGNISAERTLLFSERVKDIVRTYSMGAEGADKKKGKGEGGSSPLSDAHNPPQQVVLLPLDRVVLVRAAPKNPLENNKCVEAYYQLGPYDIQHLTQLELLEQCLSEPFYDQLRTQQQLGYSVSCGVRQTYGMLGFCFQVVSSSHSISDIQDAIFAFASSIPALLHLLPASDFKNHLDSQISEKQRADASLYDAAGFNWYEITEGKVDFQLRAGQVKCLKDGSVSQVGLKSFAESLLVKSRRLLLVQSALGDGPQLAAMPLPAVFSATFGREETIVAAVKSPSEVHTLGTITIPR